MQTLLDVVARTRRLCLRVVEEWDIEQAYGHDFSALACGNMSAADATSLLPQLRHLEIKIDPYFHDDAHSQQIFNVIQRGATSLWHLEISAGPLVADYGSVILLWSSLSPGIYFPDLKAVVFDFPVEVAFFRTILKAAPNLASFQSSRPWDEYVGGHGELESVKAKQEAPFVHQHLSTLNAGDMIHTYTACATLPALQSIEANKLCTPWPSDEIIQCMKRSACHLQSIQQRMNYYSAAELDHAHLAEMLRLSAGSLRFISLPFDLDEEDLTALMAIAPVAPLEVVRIQIMAWDMRDFYREQMRTRRLSLAVAEGMHALLAALQSGRQDRRRRSWEITGVSQLNLEERKQLDITVDALRVVGCDVDCDYNDYELPEVKKEEL